MVVAINLPRRRWSFSFSDTRPSMLSVLKNSIDSPNIIPKYNNLTVRRIKIKINYSY